MAGATIGAAAALRLNGLLLLLPVAVNLFHLARARVVRPGHHLAQLLACEVELRAGRPHEASKLWRAWLSRLGPPGRDTLWDYELTGMTYAGHTLIRLGAPVTGQRCLEIGRR